MTFEEIVRQIEAGFNQIKDYKCTLVFSFNIPTLKNKVYGKYNYLFKKPKKIRIEIVESQDERPTAVFRGKGGRAVYEDGMVKGSPGGALSFVIRTLEPTDPLISVEPFGSIDQTSVDTFVNMLKYMLLIYESSKDSNTIEIKIHENIMLEDRETSLIEIGINSSKTSLTGLSYWIDNSLKIPIKYEEREGDIVSCELSLMDIEVNSGLSDNIFSVKPKW